MTDPMMLGGALPTVVDLLTGTEKPQPVDPEVRYGCRYCKKTFPTKAKRRKHIRRRHR